ncbi:MAG: hypothetical protein LBE18_00735 [Planctomycetaceae bacterium]|jgi:hypothetical protein|nr:hypothetical protein [Planctomycetaceae bacterium]
MTVSSTNNSIKTSGNPQIGKGFTIQQWILLVFAFFLGIVSVMTIDKIFLSNNGYTGAVHAGIVLEYGDNPNPNK